VFRRPGAGATLHAADFQLALGDGEFGDASTSSMPVGASFIALTEYLPGGGLEPGKGLFAPHHIPSRLDPSAFSSRGLAHPRPGQVGMQRCFTAAQRPFCLYIVLAGSRAGRRRQLARIDHVLGTLRLTRS
jgi:hypothetical protein